METAAVIQSASLLSLSAAAGIVKAEKIAEITVQCFLPSSKLRRLNGLILQERAAF